MNRNLIIKVFFIWGILFLNYNLYIYLQKNIPFTIDNKIEVPNGSFKFKGKGRHDVRFKYEKKLLFTTNLKIKSDECVENLRIDNNPPQGYISPTCGWRDFQNYKNISQNANVSFAISNESGPGGVDIQRSPIKLLNILLVFFGFLIVIVFMGESYKKSQNEYSK